MQDGTSSVYTFHHVPPEIGVEEIGVEHLLRDIKHANTSTLSEQVSGPTNRNDICCIDLSGVLVTIVVACWLYINTSRNDHSTHHRWGID